MIACKIDVDDILKGSGLTREQLNVPCPAAECDVFAAKVDRWELLAPYIGLSERDSIDIKEDSKTYQEQRLASFRKWRNKFGSKATYMSLIEALDKISRLDLVTELCEICLKQKSPESGLKNPVEYEALLSCKDQLISELSSDVQTISRKLLDKDLIPPSLLKGQNACDIVECVLNKVKFFPEKYDSVISVLTECPWLNDLVKLLSETLGELIDVYMLYKHSLITWALDLARKHLGGEMVEECCSGKFFMKELNCLA